MSKRKYGHFFSTNCDTVLNNFPKPSKGQEVIDPFCGNGDLVNWLGRSVIEYDIEPRRQTSTQRDSLRNPPSYSNKFVLTKPPFMARNKSKDKTLFDTFGQNDLFKIFIMQICSDPPNGGILLLPVSFWSSTRSKDIELRTAFLKLFLINRVNIYEEALFEDGALSAVSFSLSQTVVNIPFYFFPNGGQRVFVFDPSTNYTIGWEIIQLSKQSFPFTVTRVIKGKTTPNTNLKLKTLDNIILSWSDEPYYGKETSRAFASLCIEPPIDTTRQKLLIEQFNAFVSLNRAKYKSLWLSNYREGARKRMGFELAYSIIKYLLNS